MPDIPEGFTAGPAPSATLDMVDQRESGHRNLRPEANYDYPRSHASGFSQDEPATWKAWAKAAGIGTEYAEAYQAPPDVQRAVNEWGLRHYGPNSPASWAASAPPGGYPTQLAGARPPAQMKIPKGFEAGPAKSQKLPEGFVAGKAPAAAGPADPSIAARQKQATPQGSSFLGIQLPPDQIGRGTAIQAELGGGAPTPVNEPSIKAREHAGISIPQHLQIADAINSVVEWGTDRAHGAIARILKQPLPGLAPSMGMSDTQANQIARDVLLEGMRRGGEAHPVEAAGYVGIHGLNESKPKVVAPKPVPGGKAAIEDRTAGPRPQSAGAAATSKAQLAAYNAVPPVPTKDFIQSVDDAGQRLRGGATADQAEFDRWAKSLSPEMRTAEAQERLHKFREGESVSLTPGETDYYDKVLVPKYQEQEDLYGEIKKFDPEIATQVDPAYGRRMVKGKSKEFDPWMGEASHASMSPVGGFRARTTGSLKPRVYHVMESERGERKLVAITDDGAKVIDKGQASPLPRYQGAATKPGDKFSINGENWEIKQARTSEIEANTNREYYKNETAILTTNIAQLRGVTRSLNEIRRLKATPEWEAYTSLKPKEGWEKVDFPPFRDTYFEPKLAHVLQDIWTYRKPALGEKMAAINRAAVMSLFWSPIPHALNAGTHWTTARGWDWVNPVAWVKLPMGLAKATREVVTQGPKYQQLLREGSGLIYGSIANEQFYRTILKRFGEDVKREPWKWDPIARALGVGPSDFVNMWYNASSRALWAISDTLMVQRVMELEGKGMSVRDAIADAEKHIPNYRIPPEVLGSRLFAMALKDPSLTVFSRYHYGMWKSYAHMAKDLAVGTGKERIKSMGNIFVTAVLAAVVWPYINRKIQEVTGNKKLELGPKGSLTIPMMVWDVFHGKAMEQVLQQIIMINPVAKGIAELGVNTDFFTKRPIYEPYDVRKGHLGRVGAQIGEKAAQTINAPYAAVAQGEFGRHPLGIAGDLAKQGLGLRQPVKPYFGRDNRGTQQHQAIKRHRKPHGLIEKLEGRAEEWLRKEMK